MSIAEHVSVFVAIVIGLAVSTLALNFHKLATAGARVRWDWLSPLLAVLMLFITVSYWWASFYWHAGARTLTIAAFLPDLLRVLLLFLAVAATLPDEVPAGGIDLRAFYFERARYIWTVQTLNVALSIAINLGQTPPAASAWGWLVGIGFNGLLLVAFPVLIVTRRAWAHGLVIVGTFVISAGINLVERIGA
jgi:hypothetical protein